MPKLTTREEDFNRRLFVGKLNPNTDDNALREYFGQYGDILDYVIMKYPDTRQSKGFGFVTFREPRSMEQGGVYKVPYQVFWEEYQVVKREIGNIKVKGKNITWKKEKGNQYHHRSIIFRLLEGILSGKDGMVIEALREKKISENGGGGDIKL